MSYIISATDGIIKHTETTAAFVTLTEYELTVYLYI